MPGVPAPAPPPPPPPPAPPAPAPRGAVSLLDSIRGGKKLKKSGTKSSPIEKLDMQSEMQQKLNARNEKTANQGKAPKTTVPGVQDNKIATVINMVTDDSVLHQMHVTDLRKWVDACREAYLTKSKGVAMPGLLSSKLDSIMRDYSSVYVMPMRTVAALARLQEVVMEEGDENRIAVLDQPAILEQLSGFHNDVVCAELGLATTGDTCRIATAASKSSLSPTEVYKQYQSLQAAIEKELVPTSPTAMELSAPRDNLTATNTAIKKIWSHLYQRDWPLIVDSRESVLEAFSVAKGLLEHMSRMYTIEALASAATSRLNDQWGQGGKKEVGLRALVAAIRKMCEWLVQQHVMHPAPSIVKGLTMPAKFTLANSVHEFQQWWDLEFIVTLQTTHLAEYNVIWSGLLAAAAQLVDAKEREWLTTVQRSKTVPNWCVMDIVMVYTMVQTAGENVHVVKTRNILCKMKDALEMHVRFGKASMDYVNKSGIFQCTRRTEDGEGRLDCALFRIGSGPHIHDSIVDHFKPHGDWKEVDTLFEQWWKTLGEDYTHWQTRLTAESKTREIMSLGVELAIRRTCILHLRKYLEAGAKFTNSGEAALDSEMHRLAEMCIQCQPTEDVAILGDSTVKFEVLDLYDEMYKQLVPVKTIKHPITKASPGIHRYDSKTELTEEYLDLCSKIVWVKVQKWVTNIHKNWVAEVATILNQVDRSLYPRHLDRYALYMKQVMEKYIVLPMIPGQYVAPIKQIMALAGVEVPKATTYVQVSVNTTRCQDYGLMKSATGCVHVPNVLQELITTMGTLGIEARPELGFGLLATAVKLFTKMKDHWTDSSQPAEYQRVYGSMVNMGIKLAEASELVDDTTISKSLKEFRTVDGIIEDIPGSLKTLRVDIGDQEISIQQWLVAARTLTLSPIGELRDILRVNNAENLALALDTNTHMAQMSQSYARLVGMAVPNEQLAQNLATVLEVIKSGKINDQCSKIGRLGVSSADNDRSACVDIGLGFKWDTGPNTSAPVRWDVQQKQAGIVVDVAKAATVDDIRSVWQQLVSLYIVSKQTQCGQYEYTDSAKIIKTILHLDQSLRTVSEQPSEVELVGVSVPYEPMNTAADVDAYVPRVINSLLDKGKDVWMKAYIDSNGRRQADINKLMQKSYRDNIPHTLSDQVPSTTKIEQAIAALTRFGAESTEPVGIQMLSVALELVKDLKTHWPLSKDNWPDYEATLSSILIASYKLALVNRNDVTTMLYPMLDSLPILVPPAPALLNSLSIKFQDRPVTVENWLESARQLLIVKNLLDARDYIKSYKGLLMDLQAYQCFANLLPSQLSLLLMVDVEGGIPCIQKLKPVKDMLGRKWVAWTDAESSATCSKLGQRYITGNGVTTCVAIDLSTLDWSTAPNTSDRIQWDVKEKQSAVVREAAAATTIDSMRKVWSQLVSLYVISTLATHGQHRYTHEDDLTKAIIGIDHSLRAVADQPSTIPLVDNDIAYTPVGTPEDLKAYVDKVIPSLRNSGYVQWRDLISGAPDTATKEAYTELMHESHLAGIPFALDGKLATLLSGSGTITILTVPGGPKPMWIASVEADATTWSTRLASAMTTSDAITIFISAITVRILRATGLCQEMMPASISLLDQCIADNLASIVSMLRYMLKDVDIGQGIKLALQDLIDSYNDIPNLVLIYRRKYIVSMNLIPSATATDLYQPLENGAQSQLEELYSAFEYGVLAEIFAAALRVRTFRMSEHTYDFDESTLDKLNTIINSYVPPKSPGQQIDIGYGLMHDLGDALDNLGQDNYFTPKIERHMGQ